MLNSPNLKLRNSRRFSAQHLSQEFRQALKNRLNNARRVAVIGMGSELRGDDIAGILVVRHLEKFSQKKQPGCELRAFNGATAPENITGEVKRFKPTHVIIVDAADIGDGPGDIRFIEEKEAGDTSFSTHRLPARLTLEYLRAFLDCETFVIGIRPKTMEFSGQPSREVEEAAREIAAALRDVTAAVKIDPMGGNDKTSSVS